MDEYKESKAGLVADVDCTTTGKELCEKHDVRGYPTIKWGDPSDLQDYNGGRSFDELKRFADENLGPTCGPDNLDLCDAQDKAHIAKFSKMDIDELSEKIEELDAKVNKISEKSTKVTEGYQKQISALQEKISKENKKKDAAIAKEKKKVGWNFMMAVKVLKAPKEESTEELDADEAVDEPKTE